MTSCSVCRQKELAEDAPDHGEAILAKGQLVCTACAEQFGIAADPPVLLVQRSRGATEEMPAASPPARPFPLPAAAVLLACLAAAGSAWALWMGQDLQTRLSTLRPPEVVSPAPGRDPGLAEEMRTLERKLAEAEKSLAELKGRQDAGGQEMARLVAELRAEAQKAREQSVAARQAAEDASRTLAAELSAAVAKAIAEKGEKTERQDGPKPPSSAGPDVLAEQYWELHQSAAKTLVQRGRLSQAAKEFDGIPARHRIPGYDQRVADFRALCERQAMARTDLVLKSLDARMANAEYAEAEALLTQTLEECAFEGVQKRLEPELEKVRALLRTQARTTEEEGRRSKALLVAGLLDELAKPDEKTRQRAIDNLKVLGPDGVGPLVRALSRPEPQVRWGILMALEGIRATEAVPAIAARLRDPDRKVRLMAADVLSAFDDTRPVPDLIDALSDADAAVAVQAETTLEKITHRAAPAGLGDRPADRAGNWRTWWESGKIKATKP